MHASSTTCYPEQLPPLTLHTRALQPAKLPLQTVRAHNLRKALALYRCQYVLLSTVHRWAPTPAACAGLGKRPFSREACMASCAQHTHMQRRPCNYTHCCNLHKHTLSYKPRSQPVCPPMLLGWRCTWCRWCPLTPHCSRWHHRPLTALAGVTLYATAGAAHTSYST